MKVKQRRVGDTLQVTTGGMFPLTFRRVGGTYWWVTKCGQHCISDKFPTVITTLTRNPHVPYISCGKDNHMHVMVARAWVYNPCPHRFHWVDHIDGDKQNNHASNLRWVSPSLNGLNKERDYSDQEGQEVQIRKGRRVLDHRDHPREHRDHHARVAGGAGKCGQT